MNVKRIGIETDGYEGCISVELTGKNIYEKGGRSYLLLNDHDTGTLANNLLDAVQNNDERISQADIDADRGEDEYKAEKSV